jgi:hypothetical protein
MELIEQLTTAAQTQTLSTFVSQNQRLFLLGETRDSGLAMGFSTFVSGPEPGAARGASKPTLRFVCLLAKSDRNAWKRRITVGRASNNDIVLTHKSVSKLHAYFTVQSTPGPGGAIEEMLVYDAESQNGTLANGRRAPTEDSGAAAPRVSVGSRVSFGSVSCEILDAASLYRRLRTASRDF